MAEMLFPAEEWVQLTENIFVAKTRLPERQKEPEKWDKEMSQAEILTSRGSVAYFLPEEEQEKGGKHVDTVIDGEIIEMKTITGNRNTLGKEFQDAYKQGQSVIQEHPDVQEHSVFIRLFTDLPVESVKAKIAGELKNRADSGRFICYFENINKLFSWSFDELRAIIGQK